MSFSEEQSIHDIELALPLDLHSRIESKDNNETKDQELISNIRSEVLILDSNEQQSTTLTSTSSSDPLPVVSTPNDIPIPLIPGTNQQNIPQETFFCYICLENQPISLSYELSTCHHRYCKTCLIDFLRSNINEAKVYIKCFHPMNKSSVLIRDSDEDISRVKPEGNTEEKVEERTQEQTKEQAKEAGLTNQLTNQPEDLQKQPSTTNESNHCNLEISHADILMLLEHDNKLTEKYFRFKFCTDNKNARECSYCHAYQVVNNPEVNPQIICHKCQTMYCFYHSKAHDFQKYPTCQAYEQSLENETKESMELIKSISKPCPGCGMPVMKSSGCNHMKCQCGVAFCWLCGKQVEDKTFPAHFQWWNPSGCSNLQMNEAQVPSSFARIGARSLSCIQIVIFGPLTFLSTLLSSVVCAGCIYAQLKAKHANSYSEGVSSIFNSCMTAWGVFWMVILFFIPVACGLGGLAIGLFAVLVLISYPFYALYRLSFSQYPWPDAVTQHCRTHYSCWNHCFCFQRSRFTTNSTQTHGRPMSTSMTATPRPIGGAFFQSDRDIISQQDSPSNHTSSNYNSINNNNIDIESGLPVTNGSTNTTADNHQTTTNHSQHDQQHHDLREPIMTLLGILDSLSSARSNANNSTSSTENPTKTTVENEQNLHLDIEFNEKLARLSSLLDELESAGLRQKNQPLLPSKELLSSASFSSASLSSSTSPTKHTLQPHCYQPIDSSNPHMSSPGSSPSSSFHCHSLCYSHSLSHSQSNPHISLSEEPRQLSPEDNTNNDDDLYLHA